MNKLGVAMAIAKNHTSESIMLTFRLVTRDFIGNITAKKRSPAMTMSVNILAHIAVTENKMIVLNSKLYTSLQLQTKL